MDKIEKRIDAVKKRIMALGPMRPGSLTRQSHGEAGGTYYSASYTFRRRGHTDYVRKEDFPRVRKETENFKKFRELCDQLVELSIIWSKSKNTPRNDK